MHKNKSRNQAITNQRHKFPLFSMLTKHLPAFFVCATPVTVFHISGSRVRALLPPSHRSHHLPCNSYDSSYVSTCFWIPEIICSQPFLYLRQFTFTAFFWTPKTACR